MFIIFCASKKYLIEKQDDILISSRFGYKVVVPFLGVGYFVTLVFGRFSSNGRDKGKRIGRFDIKGGESLFTGT